MAAPRLLSRRRLGERLGGFVYGTILVLSVIVAGAKAFPHSPGRLAVLVVVTAGVFWLAHVYADALGWSVGHETHLSLAELRQRARHEASILEACVPSVAALLLGAFGVLSDATAAWLALGVGLGLLFVIGIVFARVEKLGVLGATLAVLANLALGGSLILLKVLVAH
ncbi:MAG: hypothetical protein ACJ74R_07980 [Gaiellaceae bacterium]